MKWRPHTEQPTRREVFTALLAVRDEEGDSGEEFYLLGIFMWKQQKWVSESDGMRIVVGRAFWWLPESEVLENLKGVTHEI